jgi:hypothetical protein
LPCRDRNCRESLELIESVSTPKKLIPEGQRSGLDLFDLRFRTSWRYVRRLGEAWSRLRDVEMVLTTDLS